mmetsp:Transcript_22712/g.90108  ORF Transcript_22712/g.90108 Transcript_22712/m.90108 type:complete len:201 (+) Transcript_22712:968-1570(+)
MLLDGVCLSSPTRQSTPIVFVAPSAHEGRSHSCVPPQPPRPPPQKGASSSRPPITAARHLCSPCTEAVARLSLGSHPALARRWRWGHYPSLPTTDSGRAPSEDGARVGGDARPQIGRFLGDGSRDGRALHLALVVDDDARVVLEVDDEALLSPPGLALADDDGGHDFLAQLGLALLDGRHDEVARRRRGQLVEPALDVDD